jgi:lipopolysaccharide transport system permease protein
MRSSYHPFAPFICAWENRTLIARLAKREIDARYRGSILGIIWAFVIPILMLGVYTFVFSIVFRMRWEVPIEGKGAFALLLFSGLIIFNFFSECVTRAPRLMLENVSYIKKVVFPLEIMPWVSMQVALFNAAVSLGILLVFYVFIHGLPPPTVLLLPVVVFPLMLLILGLGWFLASLGVFLRDVQPFVGVVTTMMMFLSPIFYPLSAIPENFQGLIQLNPLTLILNASKSVMFWGQMPPWLDWFLYLVVAWIVGWLGYIWFQKTRKGFADVV